MFGKTPAPAGFGAPAAPAAGGFGKAPAAGGFGATAPPAGGFGAPAAGGFGKAPAAGGFGAPAPAAGGFGAPAPAAGGFGAPAAAGGFGKAPAAGGFGAPAPAAGGFGAPQAAAGGFGAPAAGGFGKAPVAGGFGAPAAGGFGAPAAGGFGAPAAGGFGKAPVGAPAQPQLVFTGITGPGYTAPNTPSWVTGTDLTQITDDTLVSKLPQNLQTHLGQLLEFGAKERHARTEIQHAYQQLQSESNKKGLRALQDRLDNLTTKPGSLGVDQLIVQAYHRDKAAKQLLQRAKDTEDDISNYSRDVWDRIHREGTEYWQQKLNIREGPSELLRNMLENTAQVMAQVDDVINTLAAALAPLQRHNGRRTAATTDGQRPGATPLAPPPTSRLLQSQSSAVNLYGAGGAANGSSPNAPISNGNHQLFDFNVNPTASAPADPIELVQESLQQTMNAFLNLGDNVSGLHSRANQVRDHVVRYYGETEAEDVFSKKDSLGGGASDDDVANDNEADEFVTITIGDTLKGRVRNNELIGGGYRVSKALGGGGSARSLIPGIPMTRHSMRYDPTLEQGVGNVAAVAGAAAPAAGGFGKAPAAGGFGAPAPAAGGFGAPAAPAAGFGAPAAPTAGFGAAPAAGFGAPAAPAAGFGAPAAAPAPGGFGAPPAAAAAKTIGFGGAASPGGGAMANQQGLGATPAPAGGFGGVSPASGATPSAIGQSFGGFSPSPTGPVVFGSSPAVATPNASPDERPRGKARR